MCICRFAWKKKIERVVAQAMMLHMLIEAEIKRDIERLVWMLNSRLLLYILFILLVHFLSLCIVKPVLDFEMPLIVLTSYLMHCLQSSFLGCPNIADDGSSFFLISLFSDGDLVVVGQWFSMG